MEKTNHLFSILSRSNTQKTKRKLLS